MHSLNTYFLQGYIQDVSTASTEVGQCVIPVPDGGTIIEIHTCLNGAIATADAVITCSIGTTAITGGAVTIAYSGSATGDIDVVYPTGANVCVKGQYIKCVTNGASTNTIPVNILIKIRR